MTNNSNRKTRRQRQVRPIRGRRKALPLPDIVLRDRLPTRSPLINTFLTARRPKSNHTHRVVRALRAIARKPRHLAHRADADDALDREVRLVRERAREVVRADLVPWDQRVCDQVLRPLVEQLVLRARNLVWGRRERRGGGTDVRGDERGLARGVRVAQRHDEHVAALLDGHLLVVACGGASASRSATDRRCRTVVVASRIRVTRTCFPTHERPECGFHTSERD